VEVRKWDASLAFPWEQARLEEEIYGISLTDLLITNRRV
jgi:hypothetical protein